MKVRLTLLLLLLSAVIYSCTTPGKESYDLGRDLAGQDRLEDALSMYEDALSKEPGNEEYKTAVNKAKELLLKQHAEKARAALSRLPVTYDNLNAAYHEADNALKYSPDDEETSRLLEKIKFEMNEMKKRVDVLYSEGSKAAANNDWSSAVRKFRDINSIYPNYLDLRAKLESAEDSAVAYYLKEAEKSKSADDWAGVVKILSSAREISPDNPEVLKALKDAEGKNAPEYYLSAAEEAISQRKWDKALALVKKASSLNPGGETLEGVERMKADISKRYLDKADEHLRENKLYSSYTNLISALDLNAGLADEQENADIVNQVIAAMYSKANAYETDENLGNALVWYEKVMTVSPEYKDIFFKAQNLRDKIKERVVKKIAIMDFLTPTNNAEAGRIVTDSLLSYLTTQAGSDVKILARDVLGTLLKEIELGQAGLYDIQSAKKAGRLKGTDIFIFGNVLQFDVETNTNEGFKIDNVVVGAKSVPNPAYQMWLMSSKGKPTDEELRSAPPPMINEDVRETVKFKIGTEKKRAIVSVSYRVIDVEEGEVVITKTIKKPLEVTDDFSEGVSFANIPYDPIQLPSNGELLEKATQEVISELGYAVLSRFQNLQMLYTNNAELFRKKREYEKSVEKYMDALHVEDLKNVSGPVSDNAKKQIEELLLIIAK